MMSFLHPTHRGLAIRAVDVAAGRVPGINPHPLTPLPPDSEKPIGYDQAIDKATGLNWMDTPAQHRLIGASPAYVAHLRVITPGFPLPPALEAKGYRVGESYWMPQEYAGGTDELPAIWDASEISEAAAGGGTGAPSGVASTGQPEIASSGEVRTNAPALSASGGRSDASEYHTDPGESSSREAKVAARRQQAAEPWRAALQRRVLHRPFMEPEASIQASAVAAVTPGGFVSLSTNLDALSLTPPRIIDPLQHELLEVLETGAST